MIKIRAVFNVLGILLMVLGGFMLMSLPFSFFYEGGDATALFLSSIITISVGAFSLYFFKTKENIGKREGYLIVALGWIAMSLFSTLPYLLSGVLPEFTNAFFESISGLTTTGASVISDIEVVPKGVLFWRSLTQWIGGMGIIVLTVALFPLLGIGGVELFIAEAPGPTSDKIHPRIKETAKRLWGIYVGLTVLLTFLLYLFGMTFYDAINHGLTTMATGGFSTKNASIAYFNNPSIQYLVTFFMFLAGTNYTIIYFGLKGKLKKVWKSEEFRSYVILLLGLILIITSLVHSITDLPLEQSFRNSAFQIVSIITTTGFCIRGLYFMVAWINIGFFLLIIYRRLCWINEWGNKNYSAFGFSKKYLFGIQTTPAPKSFGSNQSGWPTCRTTSLDSYPCFFINILGYFLYWIDCHVNDYL